MRGAVSHRPSEALCGTIVQSRCAVPLARLERATSWFVARRSDPLSYSGVDRGHPESHRDIRAGGAASCLLDHDPSRRACSLVPYPRSFVALIRATRTPPWLPAPRHSPVRPPGVGAIRRLDGSARAEFYYLWGPPPKSTIAPRRPLAIIPVTHPTSVHHAARLPRGPGAEGPGPSHA